MPMDRQERLELLKKARDAKTAKRNAMKQEVQKQQKEKDDEYITLVEKGAYSDDNEDIKEIAEPKTAKKKKTQKKDRSLNLELPQREDTEVTETIRVKAPSKKKIIKRTVEVEESDTEEEVIEEVVRVPRKTNEVKVSRKAMLDKLAEQNRMRLLSEIFP